MNRITNMKIVTIDTPYKLEEVVFARITQEKKRLARICLIFTSIVATISSISIIPVVIYLIQDIQQSGFYEIVSLAVSDTGALFGYWREFLLSVLEALPSVNLITFLCMLAVAIWSLSSTTKNARILLTA